MSASLLRGGAPVLARRSGLGASFFFSNALQRARMSAVELAPAPPARFAATTELAAPFRLFFFFFSFSASFAFSFFFGCVYGSLPSERSSSSGPGPAPRSPPMSMSPYSSPPPPLPTRPRARA